MSLSIVASAATEAQQKAQLPNPFELDDSQILHKVYMTHINDDEPCDKDILFKLVSNTILVSGTAAAVNGISNGFKPDFPALKRISCQMITTRGTAQCAHQTTIWILQQLRSYSWDAKALISLAAFALEYGEFLRLYRMASSDQLGSALKMLNQVENRKISGEFTELVALLVEAYQCIKEWAMWSTTGYGTEDAFSLSDVMQHIPIVVYWIVASLVASSGNLVGLSDHKLPEFQIRLSKIVASLKPHLHQSRLQIEKLEDSRGRLTASRKIKDVVELLRILIQGNGSEKPQLYEGGTLIKSGIEVFKGKYVMLFFSGLESIGDEILLLNSIHDRLQEKSTEEVKGFRKGDFKILWIPIVDEWNEVLKGQFRNLSESIKWYVLEYFTFLPGMRIIKEKFKYSNSDTKPIVAVINPQSEVMNENAMEILFEWGIEAFPFRKTDAEDLFKKWSWFWYLMKRAGFNIENTRRDSYVFLYGGNDSKWIRDFTAAIGNIRKNERIQNVDINVEFHQLGKDKPDKIPYFWIGIDGKKQNRECKGKVDCEIQEFVKSLLCLKQDPQGWVLVSKGCNIKLLGHAEPMYKTVADFELWKHKALEKESFDVAFKEYYDLQVKEISARCAIVSNTSSVLATITCPNPTCGRVMEVTSVNYRCCHRDDPNCCSI